MVQEALCELQTAAMRSYYVYILLQCSVAATTQALRVIQNTGYGSIAQEHSLIVVRYGHQPICLLCQAQDDKGKTRDDTPMTSM